MRRSRNLHEMEARWIETARSPGLCPGLVDDPLGGPGRGLRPLPAGGTTRDPLTPESHPNRFGSVSTSMMTGAFICTAFLTAPARSCGRVTCIPVAPQVPAKAAKSGFVRSIP